MMGQNRGQININAGNIIYQTTTTRVLQIKVVEHTACIEIRQNECLYYLYEGI